MTKQVYTDPKQVIVARRDIHMPPGKLAAQVAHASVAAIKSMGAWTDKTGIAFGPDHHEFTIRFHVDSPNQMAAHYWLSESFPKVVLEAKDEMEMEILFAEFQRSGLPCGKIIDSGRTVYDGQHNLTCIALGPANREDIDKITGHLPLYK